MKFNILTNVKPITILHANDSNISITHLFLQFMRTFLFGHSDDSSVWPVISINDILVASSLILNFQYIIHGIFNS